MTKPVARPKAKLTKRRQGRPVSGKNDVGRERLLIATEKLLRTLPPARVTIARIAQEANVNSALVRYYFGSRTALLVAVVDRVTQHGTHSAPSMQDPVATLSDHVRRTVQFVSSASFMHRLMIDELAQSGTDTSRARVKAMNLDLVEFYRQVLRADGGRQMVRSDPLFLYLVVLGAADFFSSAQPLIRELVPSGTHMPKLTVGFQEYLVNLVLDGLRKR